MKELIALAEAIKVKLDAAHDYDLGMNWIGDKGAKAVAEAIKFNSTLHTIDLGSNGIGFEGAKAVAEALKVNSILY
jgi:hypothetical protein